VLVPGAHAHRFLHTLATEILEAGGTFEDAAEILGNGPNIIRKYYAKWVKDAPRADIEPDGVDLWYICGTRRKPDRN
jgi:hypothetical protein